MSFWKGFDTQKLQSNGEVTFPSASASATASAKKNPPTPLSPEKIGETKYDIAESRPAGSPGQLAAGLKALRKVYGEARKRDTNIGTLKIEKWAEDIFRNEPTAELALERIQSLQPEDFIDAFGAYMIRKNRALRWTTTWVENAKTDRLARPGEEASRKHRAEARKPGPNAAVNQIVGGVGESLEDEAYRAWRALPKEERQKRVAFVKHELDGEPEHAPAGITARSRFVQGWIKKHRAAPAGAETQTAEEQP